MLKQPGSYTKFAKALPEVGNYIIDQAKALDKDLAYIYELIDQLKENEVELFTKIENNWSKEEIKLAGKKFF